MRGQTLIALLLVMVLLAGCVTTPSSKPEHKRLVGTTFLLNEDWLLCERNSPSEHDPRATHVLWPKRDLPAHLTCSILHEGTPVKIVEINNHRNISLGDVWVGVIMEVVVPETGQTVTILYFWKEHLYGPPPWQRR